MFYARNIAVNPFDMQGFAGSDWAGSTYDRRSTCGYCITLRGNMVI